MNDFISRATRAVEYLWKHGSAAIAVVLILAALVIGYSIGRPAPGSTGQVVSAGGPTTAPDAEPQMYTCAMHPTVELPDPDGKCPICFMDLIPMERDGGGDRSEIQLVLSESSARLSKIETARVARFFPTARVRLYGKLTYDQTSVARITAYFPGRIDRLFVNYIGVPVAEGDHLAEMYSPQLLAAFEELRQARLAVDQSTTTSNIVRTSTTRTLEASRGKLRLFGLTEQQITDAESGAASRKRLTVYSPISGIVTHLAAREGDYVDTGSPIATVADLSRLWLDMEAYESQLPLLRWGQPVTFTVEAHPGKRFEGQISFIEPLVDERTRTAAVRLAVDNSSGALKPGMFATATVSPRVGSGGAVVSDELAGKWVGPMHPTIVADEPGQCDICGMDLVSAESLGIVGDPTAVEEPLVIPRTAAMLTGTRAVVYVKVPDAERPTYEFREVTLGPRAGEFYIVESGLSEGEDVVVKAAFRIDSAMQIAGKPSMMMQSGGGGGEHRHPTTMPSGMKGASVPEVFVMSLHPVYAAYLGAHEALAADDLGRFNRAASDVKTAIGLVEEVGLVGEHIEQWRREAKRMHHRQPATTIDVARVRFEQMSEGVIALQARFGHRGVETWHLAFCPMAFNNEGARWLQRGTTISNPYFGAEMPGCGEIRDAFGPSRPAPGATSRP